MSNFYDQTYDNQYVSSYVQLPLSAIREEYQGQQKRLDDTQADISKTEDILHVNTDPKNQGAKQQLLSEYNSRVADVADKFTRSGNTSDANRDLQKLKRDWVNDQTRNGLESSFTNYNEHQKDVLSYNKEGKYDDLYNQYNKYKGNKTTEDFTPFQYEGMKTVQDVDKASKDVMGTISKDKSLTEGAVRNKDGSLYTDDLGEYFNKTTSRGGVGTNRLYNLAIDKAEPFLNTQGGRYWLDKQLGQEVNYNSLSKEMKKDIIPEAAKQLIQANENQLSNETENKLVGRFLPKDLRGGADGKGGLDVAATTNQTEIGTNQLNLPVEAQGKTFDTKGNITTPTKKSITPEYKHLEEEIAATTGTNIHSVELTPSFQKALRDRKINKFIITNTPDSPTYKAQLQHDAELKSNNPELANYTPEQRNSAYLEAQKGNSETPIDYKNLDGEENIAAANTVFKAGLNSKDISIIQSQNGLPDKMNLVTVADKLGYSDKDKLYKDLQSHSNYIAGIGNGSAPGQFIATIENKNTGTPIQIAVNSSKEQQDHFSRSYYTSLNLKQGKTGMSTFTDPVDGKSYLTNTVIAKDVDGKHKFDNLTYNTEKIPIKSADFTEKELKDRGFLYTKDDNNYYVVPKDQMSGDKVLTNKKLLDMDMERWQKSPYYHKDKTKKVVNYTEGDNTEEDNGQ